MAKTTWTFGTGYVVDTDHIYVVARADIYDPFERYTSLYRWCPEQGNGTIDRNWLYNNVDWRAVAVSVLVPEFGDDWWLVALSEDGEVALTGSGFQLEKIPGAGVHCDDAAGWGYLADIQQIGEHLYTAGYRGQVYKRFGPDDWRHVDEGILQSKNVARDQVIDISAVNGPHEQAIYVVGYQYTEWYPPRAFFFNGNKWREIELPSVAERLTNIYVESEDRIWFCGSNGTLLLGNANDGFKSLSTVEDNQLFLSVCKFQDKMYLGSNLGLFVYDPNKHDDGILPVRTTLKPELQDANIVDCAGDVLWSIGPKDIARFDGKTWTRIDHPDNPPIR
jgi:hypothetical protein